MPNPKRTVKLFRLPLVRYRKAWVLTVQGWMILSVVLCLAATLAIKTIYPFLAVEAPLAQADALVVGGWVPDRVLEQAITEFRREPSYQKLITTGLPLPKGFYLSEYKTFPDLTAATLMVLGLDRTEIAAVPAPDTPVNRTLASARALKSWLASQPLEIRTINLYSVGTHTRRSRYIFQQVLAPDIRVGAIAAAPTDYEASRWWQSSAGVKSVIIEVIAYVYTCLFNWQA